jgi:hypothetical protein
MKKIELKKEFEGSGDVKGFKFNRFLLTEHAIMYEVNTSEGKVHYEVFKRKFTPVCIDFEKRIYSADVLKEIYPKSKDFGVWAWCITDREKAVEKYNKLLHCD